MQLLALKYLENIGSSQKEATTGTKREPRRLARVPWPLLGVLVVQAALSYRMLWSRTAFGDEALYLWTGHLEWSHWLHGTPIPAFQTWFSGAPVIYPPIGALADSIGGLAAARMLSLVFMLGVTAFVWATAVRLFEDKRAGFFAAALFAVLGPTLHLGAFATYDALALLFLSAAAWCATGARGRQDSTGWIIAAGTLLVLSNATKYATTLFDPSVVCLATLCSWTTVSKQAALRRGALLTGLVAALIAALLKIGGSWYVDGVTQTTTARSYGSDAPSLVISDAWSWIAVAVIPAFIAVLACLLVRRWRHQFVLVTVLAGTALLAPANQARIRTTTSLNKHVDFGVWFAVLAAGCLLALLVGSLRQRWARVLLTVALSAALVPLTANGMAKAEGMVNWPDTTGLVKAVRPLTAHGGHFLAETNDVLEYYLPDTTWRQWSNTYSITEANGTVQDVNGNPEYYQEAIAHHYFSLVVLSFDQTYSMDVDITRYLGSTSGYRLIEKVRSDNAQPTVFDIWEYLPVKKKSGSVK
ncbi:MAG: glycosyltransferase family 39 protein [Streptosporangiaceae bacterium]|jgi:hypothetical protein